MTYPLLTKEYTEKPRTSSKDRRAAGEALSDRRKGERRTSRNRQRDQQLRNQFAHLSINQETAKKQLKQEANHSSSQSSSQPCSSKMTMKGNVNAYSKTLETHLDWQYPATQMLRSI